LSVSRIDQAKHAARESMWSLLEQRQAATAECRNRIPSFVGAEVAASRLAAMPQWQEAQVVKAVPDVAQEPARARALREKKLLYMAVPKLSKLKPFVLVDPSTMAVSAEEAAMKDVAARVAVPVSLEEMRPVDLVVCGSVAVDRRGVRLGKGAGYTDIELALLHETGLIGPSTTIITTVHSLQVVDGELPESKHDFGVDIIVTPDDIIYCSAPRRPQGLLWKALTEVKIASIPVLAGLHDLRCKPRV